MQAVVVRHVLSPALLPGATGRADSLAEARAAVVAEITAQLSRAWRDQETCGAGAQTSDVGEDPAARDSHGSPVVPVVVVAPARWSRLAVDARPDLAALGLDGPAVCEDPRAGRGIDESPALDVTASVAVTLVRLAGWDGLVETVEIAAPTADVDGDDLDAVLDSVRDGRRLVVLALGSADAELPAGARPALAAGHLRVRRLADRLVPVAPLSGDVAER